MRNLITTFALGACLWLPASMAVADGDTTRGASQVNDGSFNYQGYLEFEGVPANGDFHFEIHLLDNNGDEIDSRFDQPGPIAVTDGLFDMDIQMGGTQADAEFFWRNYGHLVKKMRIMVGTIQGGPYTTLSPDVDLGSTPHALWSRYASALQFPYTDTYGNGFGDQDTMLSLTHQFGGTVLEVIAGQSQSNAIISVQSPTPSGEFFASQTGGIHIDAEGRNIGLFSISDEFAVAGLLVSDTGIQSSAVIGQVSFGVPDANAVFAFNGDAGTSAVLGTPDYAGDFSGDVIARDNLRVQGEPTRDYAFNSPSPIGPLAYGSISSAGNLNSGTANISSSWDAANSWYVISVVGELMSFQNHIVSVTVVDLNEPRVATFSNIDGDILVKIWDINSGNVAIQDNFSIVIYDANPVVLNRLAAPDGVDLDKYAEKTGAQLIQTQPRNEPVEPFENYGSGISGE